MRAVNFINMTITQTPIPAPFLLTRTRWQSTSPGLQGTASTTVFTTSIRVCIGKYKSLQANSYNKKIGKIYAICKIFADFFIFRKLENERKQEKTRENKSFDFLNCFNRKKFFKNY